MKRNESLRLSLVMILTPSSQRLCYCTQLAVCVHALLRCIFFRRLAETGLNELFGNCCVDMRQEGGRVRLSWRSVCCVETWVAIFVKLIWLRGLLPACHFSFHFCDPASPFLPIISDYVQTDTCPAAVLKSSIYIVYWVQMYAESLQ